MTRTLLWAFLIFIGFSSFGQSYISFPSDSATWSYVQLQFGPRIADCRTYHYGLFGDTIIGNTNYNKLYQNNSEVDSSFNIKDAFYLAAIREDSVKKVWKRSPHDSVDQLLMDFSLNIGDTFKLFHAPNWVVNAIDSILIDGNFRRRFLFDDNASMIEGIGHMQKIWGSEIPIDLDLLLHCFKDKGALSYEDTNSFITSFFKVPNGTCHCNSYRTGIEGSKISTNIKVFPNPVSQTLSLKSETYVIKNARVEIYSNTGEKVISEHFKDENYSINVSALDPGFYIVHIYNSDEQWHSHFIKTMP